MKFNPKTHRRRSIRLKGYDYAQSGGYYVTIVTQRRECLFGQIHNAEMILNNAGKMAVEWWNELPRKFPSVTVDGVVVMPNHFHGILILHDESVGADLRVCPGDGKDHDVLEKGAHTGAPLQGIPRPDASLSQIIQWFKTMTTNEYIRGVKQSG
jgi:putative transposase